MADPGVTETQQNLLKFAIHKTFVLAGIMAGAGHVRELVTITRDVKLTERATAMILTQMLRELMREPTKHQIQKLFTEVAKLARED